MESIQREAGEVIYYDYDHRSRLTAEDWVGAAGQSIYAYQYDYDGAGNRTRKAFNGTETYYEYDETNRLLHAHEVPTDTYTYYSYDPRGNTTEIKDLSAGTTYSEYNDRDLAESIHYPGGAWNRFHYDAQGRRYAMEDSSGLTYFTWDENGMNLLCERDATGAVTRKYTHGPTPVDGIGSVAEIEDTATGGFKYPHMDHRGTVFATTGAAEAQHDAYEWNVWGEVLSETESGFGHLLGYQTNWTRVPDSGGKVIISPTRSYGPEEGRFLQVDPVKDISGLIMGAQSDVGNTFLYCFNDPVVFCDANGYGVDPITALIMIAMYVLIAALMAALTLILGSKISKRNARNHVNREVVKHFGANQAEVCRVGTAMLETKYGTIDAGSLAEEWAKALPQVPKIDVDFFGSVKAIYVVFAKECKAHITVFAETIVEWEGDGEHRQIKKNQKLR